MFDLLLGNSLSSIDEDAITVVTGNIRKLKVLDSEVISGVYFSDLYYFKELDRAC